MMQRETVLNFSNYRHFKLALLLTVLAILAYLFAPVGSEAYGGTWLGYTLGGIATFIVLQLTWYGVTKRYMPRPRRKRKPKKQVMRSVRTDRKRKAGRLRGWLSSHIFMGAALPVLVTLHAGFQFGWNVHTLAYVLLLLVVATGIYGAYAYQKYPRLMTQNMGEETLDDLLIKLAELDEVSRIRALALPEEINALVMKSRLSTRLSGGVMQQLRGEQRNCPTRYAVQQILKLGPKYMQGEQPKLMRELYAGMLLKEKLVQRVRTEIMHRARLQFWLYLHVPLTLGLLAAVVSHVVSIYFYW